MNRQHHEECILMKLVFDYSLSNGLKTNFGHESYIILSFCYIIFNKHCKFRV